MLGPAFHTAAIEHLAESEGASFSTPRIPRIVATAYDNTVSRGDLSFLAQLYVVDLPFPMLAAWAQRDDVESRSRGVTDVGTFFLLGEFVCWGASLVYSEATPPCLRQRSGDVEFGCVGSGAGSRNRARAAGRSDPRVGRKFVCGVASA